MDAATLGLLKEPEMLRIHADPLGRQGYRIDLNYPGVEPTRAVARTRTDHSP